MAENSSMTFRVPADLQAAFVAACKANDMSAAQVLRAAMRDYLERNAQPALPLTKGKGRK
jgi:hypothetical protein